MEISPSTHEILRDETGEIIIQNNGIAIREKATDTIYLMPINKEILNSFGFCVWEEVQKEQLYNNKTTEAEDTTNKWSHSDTVRLIELYKLYEKDFLSTTVTNLTVYKKISENLKAGNIVFSATQCKDKFKYLKMKYMKYKDAKKTSGATVRKFEFETEMDAIFSKKPNVKPISIASSLSTCELPAQNGVAPSTSTKSILEDEELNEVSTPAKKMKLNQKLDAVERRHKEKMAMQERAINSFETMMEKLLEKL